MNVIFEALWDAIGKVLIGRLFGEKANAKTRAGILGSLLLTFLTGAALAYTGQAGGYVECLVTHTCAQPTPSPVVIVTPTPTLTPVPTPTKVPPTPTPDRIYPPTPTPRPTYTPVPQNVWDVVYNSSGSGLSTTCPADGTSAPSGYIYIIANLSFANVSSQTQVLSGQDLDLQDHLGNYYTEAECSHPEQTASVPPGQSTQPWFSFLVQNNRALCPFRLDFNYNGRNEDSWTLSYGC